MLARVHSKVHDTLSQSKFTEEISQKHIFKTVNEAVEEYKREYEGF